MKHMLADGSEISDEQLELEAREYEAGTWEGTLSNIRVGRPPIYEEALVSVTVKLPKNMLAAIDERTGNRSDFIRRALADALSPNVA
ncbi:MAG: ribbon-helix-helix domain-containing protein [Arcanobacterium sp.]